MAVLDKGQKPICSTHESVLNKHMVQDHMDQCLTSPVSLILSGRHSVAKSSSRHSGKWFSNSLCGLCCLQTPLTEATYYIRLCLLSCPSCVLGSPKYVAQTVKPHWRRVLEQKDKGQVLPGSFHTCLLDHRQGSGLYPEIPLAQAFHAQLIILQVSVILKLRKHIVIVFVALVITKNKNEKNNSN